MLVACESFLNVGYRLGFSGTRYLIIKALKLASSVITAQCSSF